VYKGGSSRRGLDSGGGFGNLIVFHQIARTGPDNNPKITWYSISDFDDEAIDNGIVGTNPRSRLRPIAAFSFFAFFAPCCGYYCSSCALCDLSVL
jgi:hypothetical protein